MCWPCKDALEKSHKNFPFSGGKWMCGCAAAAEVAVYGTLRVSCSLTCQDANDWIRDDGNSPMPSTTRTSGGIRSLSDSCMYIALAYGHTVTVSLTNFAYETLILPGILGESIKETQKHQGITPSVTKQTKYPRELVCCSFVLVVFSQDSANELHAFKRFIAASREGYDSLK